MNAEPPHSPSNFKPIKHSNKTETQKNKKDSLKVQNHIGKSTTYRDHNKKEANFYDGFLIKKDFEDKEKKTNLPHRNLPLVVVIGVGCVLLSGNILLFVAVYFRRKKKGRRKQCVAVSGASGERVDCRNDFKTRDGAPKGIKGYLAKTPTPLCNENTSSLCRFDNSKESKCFKSDDNNTSSINNMELKFNYYNTNPSMYDMHNKHYDKSNLYRPSSTTTNSYNTNENNNYTTTSLLNFDNESNNNTNSTLAVNPSLNNKLFYQVNNTRFLPLSSHSNKLPYQYLQQQFMSNSQQLQHLQQDLPNSTQVIQIENSHQNNDVIDDDNKDCKRQINYFASTKDHSICTIYQQQKPYFFHVDSFANAKQHHSNNKSNKSNSNYSTSFSIATIFPSEANKLPTVSSSVNRPKQYLKPQMQTLPAKVVQQLPQQQLLRQKLLIEQENNNDLYSEGVNKVLSAFDPKNESQVETTSDLRETSTQNEIIQNNLSKNAQQKPKLNTTQKPSVSFNVDENE